MSNPDIDRGMYESYKWLYDEVQKIIDKIEAGSLDEITTIYEALLSIVD